MSLFSVCKEIYYDITRNLIYSDVNIHNPVHIIFRETRWNANKLSVGCGWLAICNIDGVVA